VILKLFKHIILWPSWNKNFIHQKFDITGGVCCHVATQLFLRNYRDHQQAQHSIHIHQLHFQHISKSNIAYTSTNCIFYTSANQT